MTGTKLLWIAWAVATMFVAGTAFARLYVGGDRTAFLPGETSGVHHQIEIACETCHTSDAFADQNTILKDINKTCTTCHKEELKDANDSHPVKKFRNPRMAAYWDRVDARFCTSCHSEHQPEITEAGLVTLPGDFCVACHSEGDQDVRVNRPSHAGLGYETCASAGCHNFHDNRALYEDFLVKHADAPWVANMPIHPLQVMAQDRLRPAMEEVATYLASIEVPEAHRGTGADAHWAASAHAAADVGCAGCHAAEAEEGASLTEIEVAWVAAPGEGVCKSCHRSEFNSFAEGRHGMRRHPEIARPRDAERQLKRLGVSEPPETLVAALEAYLGETPPPPLMSTSEARVVLAPEAHGQDLTCSTCHAPHEQDLGFAAVEACLTCHADDHSQAYLNSPHHTLWQAEQGG